MAVIMDLIDKDIKTTIKKSYKSFQVYKGKCNHNKERNGRYKKERGDLA